jgi:putative transposase
MRKSRFTEEQITQILAEYRAGVTQLELSRRHGVSANTISKWNARYGGMNSSEVRKVKALEDENGRLKRIVAQQALELDAAKDVIKRFS